VSSRLLSRHGTKAFQLTPSSVIAAANRDLMQIAIRRSYARNKEGKIKPSRGSYAFVYRHVKRAKSTAELLRRALAEPGLGIDSTKTNTQEIYRDQALLMAALSLAEPR